MSLLLELTRGQARVRQVAFRRGQPRPTVSIGREAAWSLEADDLEDVHGFVSFDGAMVMVRSADESNPVFLDGRAVPCAWTPARAGSVLAMGAARISILEQEDEGSGAMAPPSRTDEEVTGEFSVPNDAPKPKLPQRGALPPVTLPPQNPARAARPSNRPIAHSAALPPLDDDESTRMVDPRVGKSQPLGQPGQANPPITGLTSTIPIVGGGLGPAIIVQNGGGGRSADPDDDESTRTVDVSGMRRNLPPERERPQRPDMPSPAAPDEATMMLSQDMARTLPNPPPAIVLPNRPVLDVIPPSGATQLKPMTAPVIRPPLPDRAPASWGEQTQLGEQPAMPRPQVDPLAATGNNPSMARFVPPPPTAAESGPLTQNTLTPTGPAANKPADAAGGKKPLPKWVGPVGAIAILGGYAVFQYMHVQKKQAQLDQIVIPQAPIPQFAAPQATAAPKVADISEPAGQLPQVSNPAPVAPEIVAPGSKNFKTADAGAADASTSVERAAVDAVARSDYPRALFYYEALSRSAPDVLSYSEAVRILRTSLGVADAGR